MPDVVGIDTLLEGDLPETAANYSSLATFAAKTEEDWEDELRGGEEARWGGGLLDVLFDGLLQGKAFVVALLEGLAKNIFAGVEFIFTSISNAFSELADNFGAWWQSVTRANTINIVNSNNSLAAAVSGGVAVSDEFDGASANTLGANWSLTSSGSGAGHYGLNGDGEAVWKPSGTLQRRHVNRYTTPLATDYQSVSCVIWQSSGTTNGYLYLLARMNSAADEFVWARFNKDTIALGYAVGGTLTAFGSGSSVSRNIYSGDQIQFIVGTSTDDRQFIVKYKGVTVLTYTDSADLSSLSSSHRHVGLAAEAGSGLVGQRVPSSLSAWAASDRLSTAI